MAWKFLEKEQGIEKTVRELSNPNYEYSNKLQQFDFNSYLTIYEDEDILTDVIAKLVHKKLDFTLYIDFVTNMYKMICINKKNQDTKYLFKEMLDLFLENKELFINNNNFDRVFNAFDDKKIVLEYFRFLLNNENILDESKLTNLEKVISYVGYARQYYVDDRSLLNSSITLVRSLDPLTLKYGEEKDIDKLIEVKLKEDRKQNGIYDIDSDTLQEIEEKLEEFKVNGRTINDLIEASTDQIEIMKKEASNLKQDIKETGKSEISSLQGKSLAIIKDFNKTYLELIDKQRSNLSDEKDMVVSDIKNDLEKEKQQILALVDNVSKRITIELGRVKQTADSKVDELKAYVSNSEEVKKIIKESTTTEEILSAMSKIVNVSNGLNIGIQSPVNASSSNVVVPVPGVVVKAPVFDDRVLDEKTNYYFDKTIPFNVRFNELMRKKEEDIRRNGAIYHESFDDLLKIIMVGKKPPYMNGPSGCGKTYAVEKQVAKLLGLNVVTESYVTFEQAIIGYTNSGDGSYVPTNFYRCYKYGDVFFLDEIDNSIANAAIILNKFMGSNNESFTFPNGETIKRHPNFRIIAAGNTKGYGNTLAYNTRQKLDEATLQRMTPIEFGFDNRIEMSILQGYKGWYDFVVNFRNAIEKIPTDSGEDINSLGTFTTRDAETIKEYLDDKVFTDEKIMIYEIVETKDQDYLSKISKNLNEQKANGEFKTKEGKELLSLFDSVIEKKKEMVRCKKA